MNRALFVAASGMAAQQQQLDIISNNLANADVAGFKGAAASFTDMASPLGVPLGTAGIGTHTLFAQGKLVQSGGSFDVAIDGEGFFSVMNGRGQRAYTRDGEFSRAPDGTLRNAQGWRLDGIRIPDSALSVHADVSGDVTAQMPHGTQRCGRIRLANFPAPERLESIGGTLFVHTAESGRAHFIPAGAPGQSTVRFGMLEQSNVSIVEAMMQILTAQRAYEANAKGVQAADEMMRIADNLQRS
ncbi:MAG: flagellar hook-basal body protein [Candidatus Eremiobacteraeota bacterium]|nr:flagellar hook-basal body protein [Candidatus Eremiobacteraeota bacterium]